MRLNNASLQAAIDAINWSNLNKGITGDIVRQLIQHLKDSPAEGLLLDGKTIQYAITQLQMGIGEGTGDGGATNDMQLSLSASHPALDVEAGQMQSQFNAAVNAIIASLVLNPVFSPEEKAKLAAINEHYRGTYISIEALTAAIPAGNAGDEAVIDAGGGTDAKKALWDSTDNKWVIAAGGVIVTDAVPTAGSANAVQSGGVKAELDKLKTITGAEGDVLLRNANGFSISAGYKGSQVVQIGAISMIDVAVGEKKIMVAEKQVDGSAAFGGAIGLLDAIAGSSLNTLLSESNPGWNGDEILLTGNNLLGELGESSQWYYIESDFFLCTSHVIGTTTSNGSANWRRNRGTDCLKTTITNHANIIAQLTTESGWNLTTQFKIISLESKCGTWYKASTGGYLYMCVDDLNGWIRMGTPATVDLEITSASHPVLTASLAVYDFATHGFYLEGTNPIDEAASQGQEWWDTTNKKVYRRNMNGYWSNIN